MKTFNQITKVTLSALMIASLAGCSAGSSSSSTGKYDYLLDTTDLVKPELDLSNADGVLKSVLDNGVLTIATSPDFPAAEWITDDGTIYGSEMMLAKYVADCLGVDLQIETMDFTSTFAAVDSGKVDIAFSGFGWKADRAENYNLTLGYQGSDDNTGGHTLLVAAADADQYKTLEDFVGKTIIAQTNSLQEMYVQDQILALDTDGTTKYEPVTTLDQAILSLASGKCDAVALTDTLADNYAATSDGQFAATGIYFDLSLYPDSEGNCGLIKKGEDTMKEAVDTIIQTAKDNGYYVAWYNEAKAAAGMNEE